MYVCIYIDTLHRFGSFALFVGLRLWIISRSRSRDSPKDSTHLGGTRVGEQKWVHGLRQTVYMYKLLS